MRGYEPRSDDPHTRRPPSLRQFRRTATRCTVARSPIPSAPGRSSIVALGIVACATPPNARRAAGAATIAARKRFCAIMEASKGPHGSDLIRRAGPRQPLGSARAVQRAPRKIGAMAACGLGNRQFLRRLAAACTCSTSAGLRRSRSERAGACRGRAGSRLKVVGLETQARPRVRTTRADSCGKERTNGSDQWPPAALTEFGNTLRNVVPCSASPLPVVLL